MLNDALPSADGCSNSKGGSEAGSEDGERKSASILSLYLLGVMFTFTNVVTWWNYGLGFGLIEYMATVAVFGLAYLQMIICIGEMTSCLPFAGEYIYVE